MSVTPQDLVGNWATEGNQEGWQYPASGAWKGNLTIRANGTTSMHFTAGNAGPARDGDWSLDGISFSIIDTIGTKWTARVYDARHMSGEYDSPEGAGDGNWNARRI